MACGICHTGHGTPEIEGVGDICADSDKDEENKVDGVSENLLKLVYEVLKE